MKKHFAILTSIILGFTLVTVRAQPGGRGGMGMAPSGPSFDGAMANFFGENKGFSATMEIHNATASGTERVMQGKLAFLEGKSRFEMDTSSMTGGHQPGSARAKQMGQMGMDKMIIINRGDKKVTYMIYPGMKAYMERPVTQTNAASTNATDWKKDVTKMGEETIDGHDCIKNHVVMTQPNGTTHESIVWNATDLNKFPIKMEMTSPSGQKTVMLYKDIKLEKPDAALFEPPTDYKKYNDMMSLMMSGAGAEPPR